MPKRQHRPHQVPLFGTGAHPALDIWPWSRWGGRREGGRESFQLQNHFQKSVPLPSLLLLGAAGLREPHAEHRAQPEGEGLALKCSPKGTGWGEGTDRFPSSSVTGRPNLFPFCLFCAVQKTGWKWGDASRQTFEAAQIFPLPPPPRSTMRPKPPKLVRNQQQSWGRPRAVGAPRGCRPPGLSPHQTTARRSCCWMHRKGQLTLLFSSREQTNFTNTLQ